MKRVREDRVVRRAQIIGEAIRLAGELGYNGFTIQKLAARCGISNAGLLYYFGSKDRLLLALLDEIERREEKVIAPLALPGGEAGEASGPNYEAMVGLLRGMCQRLVDDPGQARFLVMLQAESMNPQHPAHKWFIDRDAETIEFLQRSVAPWSADPWSVAGVLLALLQGLTTRWLRSDRAFDLIHEIDKAVRIIVRPAGKLQHQSE